MHNCLRVYDFLYHCQEISDFLDLHQWYILLKHFHEQGWFLEEVISLLSFKRFHLYTKANSVINYYSYKLVACFIAWFAPV